MNYYRVLIANRSIPIVLCSTITGIQADSIFHNYHTKIKMYGAFIILYAALLSIFLFQVDIDGN